MPKAAKKFALSPAVYALILAQLAFVAFYVCRERTIYYWDFAMYHSMAQQAFAAFGHGFLAGSSLFARSLGEDYNLIYTLPSLVTFALFGTSRLVFVLTNFIFFFLPFEIAIALILRRGLGWNWNRALPFALGGSLLLPVLWIPLLEGYPDIGAAACIAFAAALTVQGLPAQKILRHGLGAGLLLGVAILLRRHFAYAAIALIVTLGLRELALIMRAKSRAVPFIRAALWFAACGAGLLGLIFLIAPDFLMKAVTVNYGGLYLSYKKPALDFLRFALRAIGILPVLAACGGLVLLARENDGAKKFVRFISALTVVWLLVWCAGPDQADDHYVIEILPLALVTGFAGLFSCLNRADKNRKIAAGILLVALAGNSLWALALSSRGVWPNDPAAPSVFSAPRPPERRSDDKEWRRLADYIRTTTTPADRILVVGSSFVFNEDLLHSLYQDDAPDMVFRMPKMPEIDHMEAPPLDVFAGSNVYVVPSPPQYHLNPAGQTVVAAAADRFPPAPQWAGLFKPDDVEFRLMDGVSVKIWRRKAWVPDALHAALAAIRHDAPGDPQFAQDWVAVGLPLRDYVHTENSRTTASGFLYRTHEEIGLFYDKPLAPGAQRVGFWLSGDCPDTHMKLSVVAGNGAVESEHLFAPAAMPGQVFQTFTAPANGDHFLQLDVMADAAKPCRLQLDDLRIEPAP